MIFEQPLWLLLLLPLGLVVWLWPLSNRWVRILRAVTYLLLVLALAGVSIRYWGDDGIVVVVADRSASMPAESRKRQNDVVNVLHAEKSTHHKLGVVEFGVKALTAQFPSDFEFAGMGLQVGEHGSNLAAALAEAQSLIPEKTPGRVVVLSDGRWSGREPVTEALRCASRGLAIDYRIMSRRRVDDIYVHAVQAPASVAEGEGFFVNAWVGAPHAQSVRYVLQRGDTVISRGERQLHRGLQRFTFRDRAGAGGKTDYWFVVEPLETDPVPENNAARFIVSVKGALPVLCISDTPGAGGYAALLRRAGVKVKEAAASSVALGLDSLAGCRAVVLENVRASSFSNEAMESLKQWVDEAGRGLVMSGGQHAFGAGGYFNSPLDPLMPVSMELREEHRKLSMSIVVVLDRSGSMAVGAGGGKTKMDLANMGAVQVLDLMSDMDQLGVVAVDSAPHTIVSLKSAADVRPLRGRILNIESMGGGIYVYEGLKAAVSMLKRVKSGARHIILFADANDAEQPGRYKALLAACREAGITCSVVALGTGADSDAAFLHDVAKRGEGRIFFSMDPTALPRLFAQDTFAVARSTFISEPTGMRTTPSLALLTGGARKTEQLSLGGYNLCYARNGATLGAVTMDEYKAPVVAAWRAGVGRVACYTGEVDGKHTGAIGGWPAYGKLLTSMARWAASDEQTLPGGMMLRSTLRGGNCRVELHLDPERSDVVLKGGPEVRLLSQGSAQGAETTHAAMRWETPELLSFEAPLSGDETVLPVVVLDEETPVVLAPVCLPYSFEHRVDDSGEGRRLLARLASLTAGCERMRLDGVWDDLPRGRRLFALRPGLILLAILGLLLEVLERRVGLTRFFQFRPRRLRGQKRRPRGKKKKERVKQPKPSKPEKAAKAALKTQPGPGRPSKRRASPTSKDDGDGDTASALRKARKRSDRRLRR